MVKPIHKFIKIVAKLYNNLFCEQYMRRLEQFIAIMAALAFIGHLFLILVNNAWDGAPDVLQRLGNNYLSALFTPFAIILMMEVILLITSIPQSMARSIVRQYEVISLVVLWKVFKDASNFSSVQAFTSENGIFQNVLLDLGTSILMFGLVAVFYWVIRGSQENVEVFGTQRSENVYISIKKLISICLVILFSVLTLYYVITWFLSIWSADPMYIFDLQEQFLIQLFSVMVFSDVLIVLASYLFLENYQLVFRNAAFIISTIFIRFSLTTDRPYSLLLPILAVVVGIIVGAMFNAYQRIVPKQWDHQFEPKPE